MTIDDAITILAKEPGNVRGLGMQVRIDALKLGIEALKRVQDLRKERGMNSCYLLPGETEK